MSNVLNKDIEDLLKVTAEADVYVKKLTETSYMGEIDDTVEEIFKNTELAKWVLKKFIYAK